MTGLSSFRTVAAAPAPTPTYTGSYATTAQDARDKCQGNVVASITRTIVSNLSLVDAIQRAKQLAIDAIVCPVFSATYVTTPEDYQAKCGAGTSGASVQRSAVSGKDRVTALATAKQLALDAIVCPVPFPNYSTILSLTVPNDPAGEVTLTLAENFRDGIFKFNANPGGDSTAKSMTVNVGGNFACLLDFPATYTGTPTGWTFEAGGHRYTGTFVDGTTAANFFD